MLFATEHPDPLSSMGDIKHSVNGNDANHISPTSRPKILHLGEPIQYNFDLYAGLHSSFEITRPDLSCLTRAEFIKHLTKKTWGDFSAIIKPFWNTGGEMGRWDRELIELLPKSMKVIASAGAGFDWVDVDVLGEHGILYCNGAGASTESVADTALFHIISVFRQMTWSHLAARSLSTTQFWQAHTQVPSASHNPRGHTLGIVGLGLIGFAIAKKVTAALGMKILYYDIDPKSSEKEKEVNATRCESLPKLLSKSDCLLLAVPAGPPILIRQNISLLPKGSRIVNIARGSLIDEGALADALASGHISAAGLDVHAAEPNVNPRLAEMNNVTLTCHTGGGSIETIKGFETLVMENVEAVLTGKEPLTVVNKKSLKPKVEADMLPLVNGGHTRPTNGDTQNRNLNVAMAT